MKRWWIILLCALLGVAVHLAVAMRCWPPVPGAMAAATIPGPRPWPRGTARSGYPPEANGLMVYRRLLAGREIWLGRSGSISYTVERVRWGWPLPSLSRMEWGSIDDSTTPFGQTRTIGPMRVEWGGVLLAGVAQGAALWGVLWSLAAARRWLRQRRFASVGCCAACGYDLRGLGAGAACPECGGARIGGAG
jgi:hypothetical protein